MRSEKSAAIVRETLARYFTNGSDEKLLNDMREIPLKRLLALRWGKYPGREELLALNARLNACRKG